MNAQPQAATLAGATVPRAELLRALRLAALALGPRNKIPILAHVALERQDDHLLVRACNLDLEFRHEIPCTGPGEIAATVPAALLLRTLAALQGEDVHLAQDERTLTLRCGPTRATFWHMPPDDLPTIGVPDEAETIEIAAETLASLLGRVQHAISREETRYYLNGVYLHGHAEHGLRAVATDGHRMAVTSTPWAEPLPQPLADGIIVHAESVRALRAMLQGLQDGVRLRVTASRLEAVTSRGTLCAKLIDGTFPDYQGVIPADDTAAWVTLPRAPLAAALRRLAVASPRHEPGLKITPVPGGADLSAGSENAEAAMTETVALEGSARWPATLAPFGLQGRYLRAVLDQVAGDLRIGVNKDDTAIIAAPILLRDQADPRAVFIIMPMRV